MDKIGSLIWGVKLPYLVEGDDLIAAVTAGVVAAYDQLGQQFADQDVIAVTESLVARTQGNYVTVGDIAQAVTEKFGRIPLAVTFPITSRNRVAQQLLGIAQGVTKVYLQLAFPADEVGNPLISSEVMYQRDIDVRRVYSVAEFRRAVGGPTVMPLTGVDYLDYYQKLADNIEIILANDPRAILDYTKNVLIAGVHRRFLDRKILQAAGAEKLYDLSDILNTHSDKHGYNPEFGLYGSNKTGQRIKLFPRDGQRIVEKLQSNFRQISGKQVEVMIYGDGAFKDPQYGIWELDDPCVAPFYTSGLQGSPRELKLKDLIDSGYSEQEIKAKIAANSTGQDMGTTPRRYTDLLGSLCDLTSGSGDKGTPVVVIKNYFPNKVEQ